MKPYVLNYSETIGRECESVKRNSLLDKIDSGQAINDATLITAVVEPSDTDEIFAFSTVITRSLEDCDDPDHILLGSTFMTEALENSDPDEILFEGSTLITKTIEPSDADEVAGDYFPGPSSRNVLFLC
ncbi:hypothetical protein [Comamonas sp. A7-5]|uniref:hypothetical protein n=1 Tax=Comamonas sp. A7-5 TaxID=673549 RepID=UPI0031DE9CB2